MATTRQAVTKEPTAISGLDDNKTYLATVHGPHRVSLATSDSAPAESDAAFTVRPGERIRFRPTSGIDVYVWAAVAGSSLVFDEAVLPG